MLHQMDLSGTWRARWTDGIRGLSAFGHPAQIDSARYIDAQVPGEIHLDLMKAGIIADPYVGTGCLAARWVEECLWVYRREFDAPVAARETGARAWLVFEGLDLAAKIFLNGVEVGRHQNFFTPCRVDVTGKLQAGTNTLTVWLDGGLFAVTDKQGSGYFAVNSIDMLLHKRHWLRKPQCQFGWDWSTRLINVGIHKPVRLEWTAETVRADQLVPLVALSKDLKSGSVTGRWFAENPGSHAVAGQLRLELAETGEQVVQDVDIKPGTHPVEAKLAVQSPRLWWPVGHGKPELYTLKATLRVGGNVVAERTVKIGFRHVEVDQSAHPEQGRYFVIKVNGRKIFCKGGNFVPADMIFARLDRARYDTLTDRALEANCNMLRIWGGGLYEADAFYELCDQKGILVWQEFIYACSKYPMTDETFFNEACTEARYQVRRLAEHPSLIIWCGNNELEMGTWHWGWNRGVVYPDYAFFHVTLPQIMAAEDPTRYYQPSSPYSPDGMDPTADHAGDQHPWSIGFQNTDFRDYRKMICRFPNEGGFLGPTALGTMKACLTPGQEYVQSFAWQIHDNSVDTWFEQSSIDGYLAQWVGKQARQLSVEDFTYWAGLVQGEALREYCDNFHRRMFDSSSAIFWMYNDCWPVTRSWTIVDYYLRRTPAFWRVRRAMAPVNVVIVKEEREVLVYGINETAQTVEGDVEYGLFTMNGEYPVREKMTVRLAPGQSNVIARFSTELWRDPATMVAFASLRNGSQLLARNRLMLPMFKEMKWARPEISVRMEKGEAVFVSRTFAWGVCLDLHGETALADNFFDLFPGEEYRVAWASADAPKVLYVGNL